jgi:hypothetical protein
MSTAHFYSDLKMSLMPCAALLHDVNFQSPPDDWHIIIADIENSTAAVQRGAHNDVNLVAAGCLTAVLNIARSEDIEVPFFFGGDGGTFIVPETMLGKALAALRRHNRNSENSFGLSLHLGAVDLAGMRQAGHYILLAKTRIGNGFSKAIVVGDGLMWAERKVKGEDHEPEAETVATPMPDMMGLECRWDRIAPPKVENEIVCYLIEACRPEQQLEVYRDVLGRADSIFGTPELRNPLSRNRLRLLISAKKLRREMMARFGHWKWGYFIAQMLKTLTARVLMRSKRKFGSFDGGSYIEELITNADTLTIDGRINTIISATAEQRKEFLQYLDAQEAAGMLVYGHHINRESVMTCYIQSRDKAHVHFVDGSDGGYTAASRELKAKLSARTSGS